MQLLVLLVDVTNVEIARPVSKTTIVVVTAAYATSVKIVDRVRIAHQDSSVITETVSALLTLISTVETVSKTSEKSVTTETE